MRALSAAELLTIWERGLAQPPVQRALALIAAACDETPPEQLARLSIGQRDARLLTLREWAFGGHIAGVATCPSCGERLELSFHSSEIRAAPPPTAGDGADEGAEAFALSLGGYALQFRLPNSADLAAIAGHADLTAGRRRLFERCILSARRDGAELGAADLPDEIVDATIAGMAEADPQAEIQIPMSCPACGQSWQATFDILAFFWHEIDHWAQRILRDVHTLASAYGWREADILALSPQRRQLYLDMVG